MATSIREAFRHPVARLGSVCLLSIAAFFVARSFRAQPAYSDDSVYKVELGDRPVLGPATAKVTIVLFGDYDCQYSRALYRTVKQVMSTSSSVRLVWAFGPLRSPEARWLARLAIAGAQVGSFWPLHDWIMADSRRALGATGLAKAAEHLKIDPASLRAAVQSEGAASRFDREAAAATALGLEHVPTLFVNGRRVRGEAPADKLQEIVEHQRESADRLLDSGTRPVDLYQRFTAGGATRVPSMAEASLSVRLEEQQRKEGP
jgi:protein-disulfide isomerase